MIDLSNIDGFEWDEGNKEKNWLKHQVSTSETEQIFYNRPLIIIDDSGHSTVSEIRYKAFGRTILGRKLAVIFTVRGTKIRPISSRTMHKKERHAYEQQEENEE